MCRLPFLPLDHWQVVLCGLVGLGFESLLAADTNLYLLGLDFGLFGQLDFQHAIVIVGAHLPRINGAGKREYAGEASVLPLNATEVLLLLFLFELTLVR